MRDALFDIEVLALRCRSEQSKTYISEAVLCYQTGAYRAAIVSAWIAVIFDLVDKVRELALAGEGNAVLIWRQYESYIQQIESNNPQGVKGALEFERTLIHTCKEKLEFFDQQQMIDLERLREDRHRCAHPSFQRVGDPYRPSAEQARLHLTNAVSHVLGQPPMQGKAQITQLVALVGSTYFPDDHERAVATLRDSPLRRASDALINSFVDKLVFDFFDTDSVLHFKKQVWVALNAMADMYRPQVEARLRRQLNKVFMDVTDAQIPIACGLLTGIQSYWNFLEQPARDKMRQYLLVTENMLLLPRLAIYAATPDLETTAAEKIATLSLDELASAISSFGLRGHAKRRAIELIMGVRSFNSANDTMNRVIFPLFDEFAKEEFITIIGSPRTSGADLVGSHGYAALIERLRTTTVFAGDELDALLVANGANFLARTG
ncbi:hypothetical protein [Duganella sp. HH105]|uniref:hypothetical protein n=1 Tax=Duganella sp. HH105 TaxID=1781067 RepID=UPI00089417E8|nr:hypothetical protein [Duganella sp. HH105]OEZ60124.1 hypothetical protein DUGA6_33540 [Duganella sp. HH105]